MAVAKDQISPRTGEDDAGFSLSEFRAVATLPATDIDRARRFYAEKLGLGPTPGAAPGHYLYQCGGATFALYESDPQTYGPPVDRAGFGIAVGSPECPPAIAGTGPAIRSGTIVVSPAR